MRGTSPGDLPGGVPERTQGWQAAGTLPRLPGDGDRRGRQRLPLDRPQPRRPRGSLRRQHDDHR